MTSVRYFSPWALSVPTSASASRRTAASKAYRPLLTSRIARCSSVGVLLLDDRDDARRPRRAGRGRSRWGRSSVAVMRVTALRGRVVRRDEPSSVSAVEQRHVAVGDDDGAVEAGGQRLEGALDGAAGALDVVLVGDDGRRGRRSRDVLGDAVALVAHDDGEVLGLVPRAARIAWATSVRPPIVWSTLGVVDFMRVPSPAARTITAVGRRSLTGAAPLGGSGCTRVRTTPADERRRGAPRPCYSWGWGRRPAPGAHRDPLHTERTTGVVAGGRVCRRAGRVDHAGPARRATAPRAGVEPTSLVLIQSQAGPAGRPTGDRRRTVTG